MAPSQLAVDLDNHKKPIIASKTLAAHVGEGLNCINSCEGAAFKKKASSNQLLVLPSTKGAEVDITSTDLSDARLLQSDDPNATDYSSSFSGTVSGNEDSTMSDTEIESRFCVDNVLDTDLFDGFDSLFRLRKKKLTDHWRSYTHSLMWRCKWIELRIKEFQSQALKYYTELALYDQAKRLELGKCTLEDCDIRSLPFGRQSYRKKVMKRKHRRRMEEKVDLPSYMSHHNLFSYYENKRPDADGALVDDDSILQVFSGDFNSSDDLESTHAWPSCQPRDDQNSLEKILHQFETVQDRVKKIKIQLDELLTQNAGKFSSMENLSLLKQSDWPSSSARSPNVSQLDGDAMPLGALYSPPHHISECDFRDLVFSESEFSCDGQGTAPDIIESTMGPIPAAEVHLDEIEDSCESLLYEVLKYTKTAEKGLNDIEKISGLPIEKLQAVVKEEKDTTDLPSDSTSKPESTVEAKMAQDQSVLNSCLASNFLVPKNKRKRDHHKARLGGAWNAGKISRSRSPHEADKK